MKKNILLILISFLVISCFVIKNKSTDAAGSSDYSNYETFSYMQFSKGKLLKNYSDEELAPYKKKTSKRKFTGWRIAYIDYRCRCNFTSKTILSIVNGGTSDMDYTLEQTETTMDKVSVSVKGSLKTSVSGTVKKFKGGLDSALGIETSQDSTVTCKTSETLKIKIDAGTKVVIYLKGSGYLTNGHATFYDMWIKAYKGYFEFFELVDVYLKIVKEKI